MHIIHLFVNNLMIANDNKLKLIELLERKTEDEEIGGSINFFRQNKLLAEFKMKSLLKSKEKPPKSIIKQNINIDCAQVTL